MFHIGRLSTVDLEEEITPEEVNSVFHQFIFIHLKKKGNFKTKDTSIALIPVQKSGFTVLTQL